jgi:hypothetical protein
LLVFFIKWFLLRFNDSGAIWELHETVIAFHNFAADDGNLSAGHHGSACPGSAAPRHAYPCPEE